MIEIYGLENFLSLKRRLMSRITVSKELHDWNIQSSNDVIVQL